MGALRLPSLSWVVLDDRHCVLAACASLDAAIAVLIDTGPGAMLADDRGGIVWIEGASLPPERAGDRCRAVGRLLGSGDRLGRVERFCSAAGV